jgi:hypothetical protein
MNAPTVQPIIDIGNVDGLSAADIAQKMENEMLKYPQVEIDTGHFHTQGIYAREIRVPAGSLMTGHTHRLPQLNIFSKGIVDVLTDKGMVRMVAPCTFVSPAGTKRVGYVYEDLVWTTVFGVEEPDVEEFERKYIVKGDAEYQAYCLEHPELMKLGG